MMRYRAISLDDEAGAHGVLRQLIHRIPQLELVACHTSAADARQTLTAEPIDLLFLDIAMPEINGLDFLRSLSNPPLTILLTAYGDFALEAFQLGVRDYLLKPLSHERLQRCLAHVMPLLEAGRRQEQPQARLAVKVGKGHRLFDPLRVSHITAEGNFSVMWTDGERVLVSEPLKELAKRLLPLGFMRVHKSHVVNKTCVSSYSAGEIILTNGETVPMGRLYKAAVVEALVKSLG